jgi:hypothetical protein
VTKEKKQGSVFQCNLAIYIEKYHIRRTKNYGKTQIFHHAKKYDLQKKSSKRNQNP